MEFMSSSLLPVMEFAGTEGGEGGYCAEALSCVLRELRGQRGGSWTQRGQGIRVTSIRTTSGPAAGGTNTTTVCTAATTVATTAAATTTTTYCLLLLGVLLGVNTTAAYYCCCYYNHYVLPTTGDATYYCWGANTTL